MDRREQIERIIIGTILNSVIGNDYMKDCRSCITADMFRDERHKRIYSDVLFMKDTGYVDISPKDLLDFDSSLVDLTSYMCELATEEYFEIKKFYYNRRLSYQDTTRPNYTRVTFGDYITKFIQLVYIDETGSTDIRGSRNAAA